jgi:serine/threonine protein kinase
VLVDVHRVDIVHRDIKPANVMVVDGGLVKVLDFGIAILRGTGALPRLTQVDRTVGTPAYMSPEQCLGQAVTSASDIYSLGCLLCELLTGDVPYHETADMPLRAHHLQSPPPSVRAERVGVPADVDALVSSMLAKDPAARPAAAAVYEGLVPLASTPGEPLKNDESRDPTRPFRRPLLAPPQRRANAGGRAAALFYAGEYTRAASLSEAVGREYRRYLPPTDPYVLDSAYHAGHAYAEIGKPDKALPQLRFYAQNTDASADEDEADKILESRFVIAQMLAAAGDPDDALTELEAIRPMLADAFGTDSTQLRNLDKQINRLGA